MSVLAGVHFLIDMFAGMLPAILPAIRAEFGISLSLGGLILVALRMTSNGFQPLIGHIRDRKRRPLLIYIGLILSIFVCLLGIVPRQGNTFLWLLLLSGVSGIGIAMVHPESLRAVHRLKRIRPAVSTAVFMAGGFFGFAGGSAISTFLVSRFGMSGLYTLSCGRYCLCDIVENPPGCRTENAEEKRGPYRRPRIGLLADYDNGNACGGLDYDSGVTASDSA